jgi:hypothetical protein
MIWYCPKDFYQKIFGSFPADVVDFLLGIPVRYCGASAICLDLPSVESLKRFGRSWWCLSVTVVQQQLAI